MKSIIQISILITGIIVAIICIKTTTSIKTINYQKEHLSHNNKASDSFIIKTLPHYDFKK